ncbi:hypothetical protein GJAV_G00094100 [Gymnothorax javanicus]|nr:hypothetical protein GJAV_G00094100 [Gymnothorax javanicus]
MKQLLFIVLTCAMVLPLTDSRAVKDLLVRQGDSAHLNVMEYERLQCFTLKWKFNTSVLGICSFKDGMLNIAETFKAGIQFDKKNCSLILENVQQNNSGNYAAMCLGKKEMSTDWSDVVIYWLIVQGLQEERKGGIPPSPSHGFTNEAFIAAFVIFPIFIIIPILLIVLAFSAWACTWCL